MRLLLAQVMNRQAQHQGGRKGGLGRSHLRSYPHQGLEGRGIPYAGASYCVTEGYHHVPRAQGEKLHLREPPLKP